VRFRQHEHQRPTLVLLASRWKPEEHKNGSVCKTAADASKPEAFLTRVEITKPLQQIGRFRFRFRKIARQQAVRSSFSPKEENSACFQTDRNHGGGLRYLWAFGWNHAGGDGRTSAHNPRLLAAQQPSCHEQIPSGNIEDQTLGTGQIGRRYFADRYFAEDKPNPMSAVRKRSRMGPFSFCAYRPLTSPDLPGALLWSVLGPWSPVPKCDAPGAPISVEEHTSMARRQSQNPPLQNSSAIPALPWPLRPRLRYSPGLAPTTRLNALLNAASDS
jgi:hypothetical protein